MKLIKTFNYKTLEELFNDYQDISGSNSINQLIGISYYIEVNIEHKFISIYKLNKI